MKGEPASAAAEWCFLYACMKDRRAVELEGRELTDMCMCACFCPRTQDPVQHHNGGEQHRPAEWQVVAAVVTSTECEQQQQQQHLSVVTFSCGDNS
eukprot:1157892-Pelagomonas_calceolata.AAC.6